MAKRKTKFTEREIQLRDKIENELGGIEQIDPQSKQLLTPEGFMNYFLEMQHLYDTQNEAYEKLEKICTRVTGRRHYNGFHSFTAAYKRRLSK